MIQPIFTQNLQIVNRNISNNVSKPYNETVRIGRRDFPKYSISFCSAQIQHHSKGSTPQVARQLKSLEGDLDDKLLSAKEIILNDMGLPSELVECVDEDLKGTGYAAYSAPLGKVLFDKKFCQKPDAEFSDDAIMCILRHELDHMEVFTKLYKKLGSEEFEKLLPVLYGKDMPKVNHEFYKEMSKYVSVEDFDSDKFINAIKNYSGGVLGDSYYNNFMIIIKNFDNALEDSAREKQYELESLMNVTTLKDFYSMIDETKKLTAELKLKGITDEQVMQETFDNLYKQAMKSTGLKDKTQNWAKLIIEARQILRKQPAAFTSTN